MDYLFQIGLAIVVALLALFGIKRNKPKLPADLNNDRVEELEEKLEDLEKKEEELAKDGAKELSPEEVEGYWDEKK